MVLKREDLVDRFLLPHFNTMPDDARASLLQHIHVRLLCAFRHAWWRV